MLTETDLEWLREVFPELDWMRSEDWQAVAAFADWTTWLDEEADLSTMGEPDYTRRVQIVTKLKRNRKAIRKDCRRYFGEVNVPNINDPEEKTWA